MSRGFDVCLKKNLEKHWWAGLTYTCCWNREKREGKWKKYQYSIPVFVRLLAMQIFQRKKLERVAENKWLDKNHFTRYINK